MEKKESWIMLYSERPVAPDNRGAMDTATLSHYLHLPERSCEKEIYLYLVRITDDVPDYSTLKPFIHSSLMIIPSAYEKMWDGKEEVLDKGLEGIRTRVQRKQDNCYILKIQSYEEKDYGRGIRYLTLRSTICAMDGIECLKILIGATHHWNIVCSENRINLKDRKCISGTSLRRSMELSGETAEREVYLYLVKGSKDVLICSSLQPLCYHEVAADYCIRKGKAIERMKGSGVSLLRRTENKYLITVNNAVQKDFPAGRGEYMVRPILPGEIEESKIIHEFKVDTLEQWCVLCTEKPLDLDSQDVIPLIPLAYFSTCVRLPIFENGRGHAAYYLYMARKKEDSIDFHTILPVTTEAFDIKSEDVDDGPTGLAVSKIKDNYYLIQFDEEEREYDISGWDSFSVTPKGLSPGKQVDLHGLKILGYYDFAKEGDCENGI